ncbi:hypothetical protein KM915_25845 [Cytobacillus oceanisediminis]|uniref:hypothetical protein n=1 Tax=Cytobacillus oceanisediminis TaxID=665099 RepID=UPI001C212B38|nr:hypothetical protein [Cytobacillus oceanisediminis]MBU8733439.1 hypothetical protein [Cytobacillus oceanisediminis]
MSKKKENTSKVYKVIMAFKDKNTREVYAAGDDYEADAKRLKELQSKGYIEEVKADEQPSE